VNIYDPADCIVYLHMPGGRTPTPSRWSAPARPIDCPPGWANKSPRTRVRRMHPPDDERSKRMHEPAAGGDVG
jgi:hypothetical protein